MRFPKYKRKVKRKQPLQGIELGSSSPYFPTLTVMCVRRGHVDVSELVEKMFSLKIKIAFIKQSVFPLGIFMSNS